MDNRGMTRRQRKFEQFQDFLVRLYPELHGFDDKGDKVLSRTVTFQVTDACNLFCTYCYQINKGKRRMKLETAKKFIDLLLSGDKGMDAYMNVELSPAIILDFIGGEPLLEIELIDEIVTYFEDRALELMHPWATKYQISICSNGVLYFDPKVQQFLDKHRHHMSFSVTIDGNKTLHDACRVFEDGSGSYDMAVAAAQDWIKKGGYMGSKMTIAPDNVMYVYEALIHMIDLGYHDININCVYEEGWTPVHATVLYDQLKKCGDYFLEHDLDFSEYTISIFENHMFHAKSPDDNDNWCGGTGMMISVDPDGYIYPCVRYMESSLGNDQPPYRIGNVDDGIASTQCECDRIECMKCITRRSQSTDECFDCPIAEGCAWCSAYNYQVFGTPDARATYICIMHHARALANLYFWNKYFRKYNYPKWMKNNVPEEKALQIITKDEWDMINELCQPADPNDGRDYFLCNDMYRD